MKSFNRRKIGESAMSAIGSTKVITPPAMLSYPHLDKPQAPQAGSNPNAKAKYSATFVFEPGSDLRELEAAARLAAEERWPGKSAVMFQKKQLKWPFRTDAESKGYANDSTFINCRTEQKPGVVLATAGPDGKPQVVADEDIRSTVYPGCIVRGSVRAFAYDISGNRGVSFALNNIQKLADG
jgi:hypothetical protein